MRSPSKASAATAWPFSVISVTAGAVSSMNVPAPGRLQSNVTVLAEVNVSAEPVRSSSTW